MINFFAIELLQQLIFWYWSNIVLVNLETGDFESQNTIVSVALVVIVIYFVL